MSQHSQFSHHHHHPHSHPAVLHNASLAEIASQPASSHHYSSNLGSAVASSMHLTNSTSETDAGNSSYKMEHDMMYYSVSAMTWSFVCRRLLKPFFSPFSFSRQTRRSWITPMTASWIPFSTMKICSSWTWLSTKVSLLSQFSYQKFFDKNKKQKKNIRHLTTQRQWMKSFISDRKMMVIKQFALRLLGNLIVEFTFPSVRVKSDLKWFFEAKKKAHFVRGE